MKIDRTALSVYEQKVLYRCDRFEQQLNRPVSVSGFGAIVGAWANRSFLERLGETAILSFELRKLQEWYGDR
jgi:hypothetical protein